MRRAFSLTLLAIALAKEDEKKIDGPVIGIDLGTTYSSLEEKAMADFFLKKYTYGSLEEWISDLVISYGHFLGGLGRGESNKSCCWFLTLGTRPFGDQAKLQKSIERIFGSSVG